MENKLWEEANNKYTTLLGEQDAQLKRIEGEIRRVFLSPIGQLSDGTQVYSTDVDNEMEMKIKKLALAIFEIT